MNGVTFAELKTIDDIWLVGNECIDDDFFGAKRISQINKIVTEKCGFCEATNPIDYTTCEKSKQLQTLESFDDCESDNKAMISKLEKLSEENLSHVITIATLKVELEAVESAQVQAEKNLTMEMNGIAALHSEISDFEIELKDSQDEVKQTKDDIIEAKGDSGGNLNSLKEFFDKLEAKLMLRLNTTKDE